jgi:hypothetical protein
VIMHICLHGDSLKEGNEKKTRGLTEKGKKM